MRIMVLILVVAPFLAVPSAHAVFAPIPPDQLDFYKHYSLIYAESYLNTCANPANHCFCDPIACPNDSIFKVLEPNTADINGGFNPREVFFYPNGMLDCQYEMAMIAVVLKKAPDWRLTGRYGEGVDREEIAADWEFNLTRPITVVIRTCSVRRATRTATGTPTMRNMSRLGRLLPKVRRNSSKHR